MVDLPDDLPDVGAHRGKNPPEETGQTVRSPEGPDPSASRARSIEALFQVIRGPAHGRLVIRAHPARAEATAPETGDEVGQFRTAAALRDALADVGLEEWVAVFEDAQADRMHVDDDVTAHHAWLGRARYSTVAFFETIEEARSFADAHGRPAPDH
jgi:hypothetical protein